MARLVESPTRIDILEVSKRSSNLMHTCISDEVGIFDSYPTIFDLETNMKAEKPLQIQLDLDQLEDFEE